MSSAVREKKYNALVRAGKAAQDQGDWRDAATTLLQTIVSSPTRWTEHRWQCFLDYSRILQDAQNGVTATADDISKLKQITRNEQEAILFRSEALFLRGFIEMNRDELEAAAIYYGRVLHLIPKATAAERRRQVKLTIGAGSDDDDAVNVSVRDQLETLENNARTNLEFLEDPANIDEAILASVPRVNGVPNTDIVRRLTVGGASCDSCGKSREAVQENFQRCVRCKRAYYCSEECQILQWGAGHKKACREPGQIKPGDYMMLRGIVARAELNNKLCRVVKEANTPGRWAVKIEGETKPISIAHAKMVHIRPAK